MDALELDWAFGINPNYIHLLRNNDKHEQIIFYPVSNYGVIYNTNTSKQSFLMQHANMITSATISSDKSLIVLGDSGASSNNTSIISIWNASAPYNLITTYELPINCGVQHLAINPYNNLLCGIINESVQSETETKIVQHLMVWSLHQYQITNPEKTIQVQFELKLITQVPLKNDLKQSNNFEDDSYHFITFNHDSSEIITHGSNIDNFIFWSLKYSEKDLFDLETENKNDNNFDEATDQSHETQDFQITPYYVKSVDYTNHIDLTQIGKLTQSVFLPINDGPLITGTNNGDLIVWDYDNSKSSKLNKILIENEKETNPSISRSDAHRIFSKLIPKISRGAINCVYILNDNDIIVLGSSSGSVRFYDFEFRVIGWLDYLCNHNQEKDQVISISFPLDIPRYGDVTSDQRMDFKIPNMIIGTKNNKIINVEQGHSNLNAKNEIILDTFNSICTSMASHPSLPYLAVATKNSEIQIWDMMNKRILQIIKLTQSKQITDIKFSPNGQWLIFGTDGNYLRVYDTQQFQEHQFFKTNYDGNIGNLCFSFNGEWFAFSQSNRISVYKYWYGINDVKKEKPKDWTLIGNYISHNLDIIDLHFGIPSGIDTIQQRNIPRLFSIGYDKLLNEYDLKRSSASFGLRIKYTFQLTTRSIPTTLAFIPGITLNTENLLTFTIENEKEDIIAPKWDSVKKEWKYIEDTLIIFDDELKLHFYHAPRSIPGHDRLSTSNTQSVTFNNKTKSEDEPNQDPEEEKEEIEPLIFRRTVLGPCYNAPIKNVVMIEDGKFVYCTYDQIIGSMQGPFNGNPYRYFGCNAHPGKINGFELIHTSQNEALLATNGGYDKSILIWKVNTDILNQQIIECDEDKNLSQIYIDLLNEEDGDKNIYEEIKNYFYYVEIENQGTISTVPRSISGKIDIKQITSIFQAMGCFLTLNDIERIKKEIIYRFSNHINNENVKINLKQFIELFINHRSTFDLSINDLNKAFENLVWMERNKNKNHNQMTIIDELLMNREFFIDTLQRKGDKISRDELMNCLESLTGYNRKQLKKAMPSKIDSEFFVQNILGLRKQ